MTTPVVPAGRVEPLVAVEALVQGQGPSGRYICVTSADAAPAHVLHLRHECGRGACACVTFASRVRTRRLRVCYICVTRADAAPARVLHLRHACGRGA
eukprot:1179169-Prorocentrum_minimum.AAC.2